MQFDLYSSMVRGKPGNFFRNPPCPGAGCLPSGPACRDLWKGKEATLLMSRLSSAGLLCMLSTCEIQGSSAAFTSQPRGSAHAEHYKEKKKNTTKHKPNTIIKKNGKKHPTPKKLLVWKFWHFWHLGFPSLKW